MASRNVIQLSSGRPEPNHSNRVVVHQLVKPPLLVELHAKHR
jgi:hypothetical protein